MLFEITRQFQAGLRDLPVEVIYGDERFERDMVTDNRIIIRHLGPETWTPPKVTQDGTAPIVWTRWIGVSVEFQIRSDAAGADEIAHQRLLDEVLRAFMSALLVICQERRIDIQGVKADSQGIAPLEDGPTGKTAAVYEMSFQLAMGIKFFTELASVDASTLTAQGTTTVTQGNQVQVACSPPEEEDP